MKKPSDGSTPEEKSRLLDQLEDMGRASNDPAEKDRLARIVSGFRNAIVAGFVKRPPKTDEGDKKDES